MRVVVLLFLLFPIAVSASLRGINHIHPNYGGYAPGTAPNGPPVVNNPAQPTFLVTQDNTGMQFGTISHTLDLHVREASWTVPVRLWSTSIRSFGGTVEQTAILHRHEPYASKKAVIAALIDNVSAMNPSRRQMKELVFVSDSNARSTGLRGYFVTEYSASSVLFVTEVGDVFEVFEDATKAPEMVLSRNDVYQYGKITRVVRASENVIIALTDKNDILWSSIRAQRPLLVNSYGNLDTVNAKGTPWAGQQIDTVMHLIADEKQFGVIVSLAGGGKGYNAGLILGEIASGNLIGAHAFQNPVTSTGAVMLATPSPLHLNTAAGSLFFQMRSDFWSLDFSNKTVQQNSIAPQFFAPISNGSAQFDVEFAHYVRKNQPWLEEPPPPPLSASFVRNKIWEPRALLPFEELRNPYSVEGFKRKIIATFNKLVIESASARVMFPAKFPELGLPLKHWTAFVNRPTHALNQIFPGASVLDFPKSIQDLKGLGLSVGTGPSPFLQADKNRTNERLKLDAVAEILSENEMYRRGLLHEVEILLAADGSVAAKGTQAIDTFLAGLKAAEAAKQAFIDAAKNAASVSGLGAGPCNTVLSPAPAGGAPRNQALANQKASMRGHSFLPP